MKSSYPTRRHPRQKKISSAAAAGRQLAAAGGGLEAAGGAPGRAEFFFFSPPGTMGSGTIDRLPYTEGSDLAPSWQPEAGPISTPILEPNPYKTCRF